MTHLLTCRLVIMVVIEVCWNIYPATAISSFVLFATHLFILLALWIGPDLDDDVSHTPEIEISKHDE